MNYNLSFRGLLLTIINNTVSQKIEQFIKHTKVHMYVRIKFFIYKP